MDYNCLPNCRAGDFNILAWNWNASHFLTNTGSKIIERISGLENRILRSYGYCFLRKAIWNCFKLFFQENSKRWVPFF